LKSRKLLKKESGNAAGFAFWRILERRVDFGWAEVELEDFSPFERF